MIEAAFEGVNHTGKINYSFYNLNEEDDDVWSIS
jgi:hypothetical protein